MKVTLKKLSFWLPVLSLFVCFYNLSGADDKNLLLFLTSPLLLWFNPQLTDLHYSMNSERAFLFVLYGIHFFSWLIFGLIIDWLYSRYKSGNHG
ncbi:Permease [Paenibacillus typhae]|uniref:Uncharacterized protein n=1 Tax=Paenibacillus typhae TaxID=1174501 RepID=A0A1G8V2B9_9BACL|nr:hypothetical protein SAMN05216192_12024 [Paenibacillus typhae]